MRLGCLFGKHLVTKIKEEKIAFNKWEITYSEKCIACGHKIDWIKYKLPK